MSKMKKKHLQKRSFVKTNKYLQGLSFLLVPFFHSNQFTIYRTVRKIVSLNKTVSSYSFQVYI